MNKVKLMEIIEKLEASLLPEQVELLTDLMHMLVKDSSKATQHYSQLVEKYGQCSNDFINERNKNKILMEKLMLHEFKVNNENTLTH